MCVVGACLSVACPKRDTFLYDFLPLPDRPDSGRGGIRLVVSCRRPILSHSSFDGAQWRLCSTITTRDGLRIYTQIQVSRIKILE